MVPLHSTICVALFIGAVVAIPMRDPRWNALRNLPFYDDVQDSPLVAERFDPAPFVDSPLYSDPRDDSPFKDSPLFADSNNDSPIFNDPRPQKTSKGKTCKTECSKAGGELAFCMISGTNFDYCSPNNGDLTSSGSKCKSDHSCGKHGRSYNWCNAIDGKWDYCVP